MPYGSSGLLTTNPLGNTVLRPGQTLVLPGVPLPYELINFQAPEPSGGRAPPGVQPATMVPGCCAEEPEVLSRNGDVGEWREFAEDGRTERVAPGAADG